MLIQAKASVVSLLSLGARLLAEDPNRTATLTAKPRNAVRCPGDWRHQARGTASASQTNGVLVSTP